MLMLLHVIYGILLIKRGPKISKIQHFSNIYPISVFMYANVTQQKDGMYS